MSPRSTRPKVLAFGKVASIAFLLSISAQAFSIENGLYWQVEGEYRVSESIQNAKYRTIKEACEAGVSGKESYWSKDGYRFRTLGGIDARKNPETGASGGSYSWSNWGLKPGDSGFDDSARSFYCNHEYKKPGRDSWSTYWPYSGATVTLRGYRCAVGMVWDSEIKGCTDLPTQNCPAPSTRTENPIDTASGVKYFEVLDFAGSSTFPVPFKRFYSTINSEWSHTFGRSLALKRGGESVMVRRDSGAAFKFRKIDNQWESVTFSSGSLDEELDINGQRQGWRYVNGGVVEFYDAGGSLVSVETPSFGTFVVEREGSQATVVSPTGASIVLAFDTNNRLRSFTNPSGGLFRYVYSGSSGINRLARTIYPTNEPDPTPSTTKDNAGRQFFYENPTFPSFITGIIDANGNRAATVEYDSEGRATVSELANGAERVSVSYNSDGSRTITNALGKDTTYRFVIQGKQKLLTEIEGHPSQNCGGSGKSYTYNSDGLVETKTDWAGYTTRYAYNPQGQIVRIIEAEGTSLERITLQTWHQDFNRPTSMSSPEVRVKWDYDELGRLIKKTKSDQQ